VPASLQNLVVHIGSHKSGTTSIQDFCSENHELLTSKGIFYPAGLCTNYPRQHSDVARLLNSGDVDAVRVLLTTAVEKANSCGAHTVFMSGEDLCTLQANAVKTFTQLCDQHFESRKFIFVVRGRSDYLMSLYKHNMRYGAQITESTFIKNYTFSPKNALETWKHNFSELCDVILYDDHKDKLISAFFDRVFGFQVEADKVSNASLDMLMLHIYNTFLKNWDSHDVEKIIWDVGIKHKSKMNFELESLITKELACSVPDGDWYIEELKDPEALLRTQKKQMTHDPLEVCDKMLSLFHLLRDHFERERCKPSELTSKNRSKVARTRYKTQNLNCDFTLNNRPQEESMINFLRTVSTRFHERAEPLPPLHGKTHEELVEILTSDTVECAGIPKWPDEDTQRAFAGNAGAALVRSTQAFIDALDRGGAFERKNWKALEFGCGWGRIASVMLTRGTADQLDLCDAWQSSLDIAASCGLKNQMFKVSELTQPGEIPSNRYEFAYAMSIFTHLDRASFEHNIAALMNSLKSQGNMFFTVRFQTYIDALIATNAIDANSRLEDGFWHVTHPGQKHFGKTAVSADYIERIGAVHGEVRYLGLAAHEQHLYCITKA